MYMHCLPVLHIRMHIHECTTLCHINKLLKFFGCQKKNLWFLMLQKGFYPPGLHIRINAYMWMHYIMSHK